MQRERRVQVVLLFLMCGAGCGGSGTHLEDPAVCKAAWQPLTAPQPFLPVAGLVTQGQTVYYSTFSPSTLVAQPTDGSAPTTLASVGTAELWIEGDHLLFTGGDLANQIYSLPPTGGTPQLVLDGGAGRTSPNVAMAHAFTAGDFYWIEQDPTARGLANSTVWDQARSGGMPIQIGATSFTDPSGFDYPGIAIGLSASTLVIGSAFGQSATVPVGGGTAASLLAMPTASAEMNVESDLAGVDVLGAYWSVPGVGDQPGALILSPADGGPAKPFFASVPGNGLVQRIWPTGDGDWVMTSLEIYSDGIDHMTLWLVDAQGKATRLGCSPSAASNSWIEKGVAVAPDAVYVPAENLSADTWEIDRIAR